MIFRRLIKSFVTASILSPTIHHPPSTPPHPRVQWVGVIGNVSNWHSTMWMLDATALGASLGRRAGVCRDDRGQGWQRWQGVQNVQGLATDIGHLRSRADPRQRPGTAIGAVPSCRVTHQNCCHAGVGPQQGVEGSFCQDGLVCVQPLRDDPVHHILHIVTTAKY